MAETLCLVLEHAALIAASAPIDRIDIAFIIRFLVCLLSVSDVVADALALRFFSQRYSMAQRVNFFHRSLKVRQVWRDQRLIIPVRACLGSGRMNFRAAQAF